MTPVSVLADFNVPHGAFVARQRNGNGECLHSRLRGYDAAVAVSLFNVMVALFHKNIFINH